MLLITLTGLDGSGKSTQLELLKEKIQKAGKTFFAFHILDFSLANQIARKNKKGASPQKAKTSSGPLGIFLRKIFLLIDLVRFHFFLKKMKRQKLDFLLADRYFFDQIANIFFLSREPIPQKKPGWQKIAEKLLIKPTCGFHLSISPTVIQTRDRSIEQGAAYLKKKKVILDKLSNDWNLYQINANQEKEVIANLLWQKIQKII